MRQWIVGIVAVALVVPAVAQAQGTDDAQFWKEREDELWATISPEGAADDMLRAQADPLAAFRAARALDLQAPEAQATAIYEAAVAKAVREALAGIFSDPQAVLAAADAGELDARTLDALGLDAAGVQQAAPILAALTGAPAARFEALAVAAETPRTVWQQDTWDNYGLAVEVVLLAVAMQAPELAGWILPHDIRVMATHIAIRIVGPVREGNTNNGRVWTQAYADAIVGIAMDNHGLVDALVFQIPITLYVELSWRCTRTLFGTCVGWSYSTLSGPGDPVIATNATYTFAYPANAGQLATRATGQDLLQSVYDRLGRLSHAGETDYALRAQLADTPGANELATQAPPVSFAGTQLPSELADLWGFLRNARVHPPATGIDVAGAASIPANLGPTVGYKATKVQNGDLNILVVRWHNLALQDLAAPGTFYYDVPAGEYKLTNARVDAWGGVYIQDWAVAGSLPVALPAI